MPVIKSNINKKEHNSNMLKVLFIAPNKLPIEKSIPSSLEARQNMMGCEYIEIKYLDDKDICILCSADGKKNNLPANRYVKGHGMLYGNLILMREVEGAFKSLKKDQIAKYKVIFDEGSIEYTNNHILGIMNLRRYMRR